MSEPQAAQESPGRAVAKVLESSDMRGKFMEALPPDIPPDRFTRVVITAINMRPELLDADRQSLYTSCLRAAQDGLLPDGREGVLNIYNTNVGTKERPQWVKKVQWMPMVEGVIKQMAKAGISVYAATVHAHDKIRMWNDDRGQHIEHEPAMFTTDSGPMIGVYARGVDRNGNVQIEAMNIDEINQARKASKNANGAIFEQWPDRMAQKTVLHRLRKRMAILDPKIAEDMRRAEIDDLDVDDDDIPPPPVKTEMPQAGQRPRALQAVVDHGQPPDEYEDIPSPAQAPAPQRRASAGPPVPPPDDGVDF
ncbi:MAG: recombinase RecT [Reyranella sp.]|uniref:recombinase RecT n=1 Tax=Reyranella sp. TaxID=1929291 RepID=UPI003D118A2F